jgi:glycosyltransferase involved in cell wall biosynthesis
VERFRKAAFEAAPRRDEIRRRFGFAPSDFIVAFSGKLVPRKRPLDLVEAVRRVENPAVKALMIGSGPLEDEVRERGGDRVAITGFVNQSEIPAVLAAADLFVMPSDMDAHPLAVTEALACGIPVLVSDLTGCHGPDDAVRDGLDGFVFRCGDVDELSRRIRALASDPTTMARLSEQARRISMTQSAGEAAGQLAACLASLGRAATPGARGWQDRF